MRLPLLPDELEPVEEAPEPPLDDPAEPLPEALEPLPLDAPPLDEDAGVFDVDEQATTPTIPTSATTAPDETIRIEVVISTRTR